MRARVLRRPSRSHSQTPVAQVAGTGVGREARLRGTNSSTSKVSGGAAVLSACKVSATRTLSVTPAAVTVSCWTSGTVQSTSGGVNSARAGAAKERMIGRSATRSARFRVERQPENARGWQRRLATRLRVTPRGPRSIPTTTGWETRTRPCVDTVLWGRRTLYLRYPGEPTSHLPRTPKGTAPR